MNSTVTARLTAPLAVTAAALAVCIGVSWADPTTPGGIIPQCPTKALLGIDCPGCGSMRMLQTLCQGDVFAALRFNALGLVAVAALAVSFVAWTIGRILNRPLRQWYELRHAPSGTLALVLTWFVIRNIPYAPFTALHV